MEEFGPDLIVFRSNLHLNDMTDPVSWIDFHFELQFLSLFGLELEVIFKLHLLFHSFHFFSLRTDEDGYKLKFNGFFV